jgi:hypothetical protein
MGFFIAIQAFFKALKEPEKMKEFLDAEPKKIENEDPSHIRLIALLQQSGRLVDFLKEDISPFSDEQVGGVVRQIHEDTAKCLEEFVTIRPVRDEMEGSVIRVEKGYDPSLIKIVGNVSGQAPYTGVLIHKGWKAHKKSLPKKIGKQTNEVITPAEVEVK